MPQYDALMGAVATVGADLRPHRIQQGVKWTVYVLLFVNFGFYIVDDWVRASYTLHSQSTFFDWTGEFATTIDLSAWFILLLMFELETHTLSGAAWKGWVANLVHGLRLLCFVMIAHTVYAYVVATIKLAPTVPVERVANLCDLVDDDLSYVYNLEYTAITPESCDALSTATEFYRVGNDPVVSDLAGLTLERHLVWADLYEVLAWLVALLAIEVAVRLRSRGVTGGALIRAANWTRNLLYLTLVGVGLYWASLSHWLFLWDELLWIGGFMVIDMNMSEGRRELRDEPSAAAAVRR